MEANARRGPRISTGALMALAGIVILVAGAISTPRESTAAVPLSRNSSPSALLGSLEGRDQILRINSSETGMWYEVADADGTVLATNLSREQLRASFPHLDPDPLVTAAPVQIMMVETD